MPFKFESLHVWHDAMDLNDKIHLLTKQYFPKDEQFVLSPQIRRASDSIVLNIAEGCTGQTDTGFKRFTGYSSHSAVEVVSCLVIANRRGSVTAEIFLIHYLNYEVLRKIIIKSEDTLL